VNAPRRANVSAARSAACLAIAAAALFAAGCGGGKHTVAPPAGQAPWLGLVPNTTDAASANSDSALAAIDAGKATGVNVVQSGDLWSAIEPSPGAIDGAHLRLVAGIYRSLGLARFYNLQLVDTNQRGVPADLASTAWDDPVMVARADAVVDTIVAVARTVPLVSFSFGNEVDGYFGQPGHQAELPAFTRLLRREIARVHAALPGLPVGCCVQSPPLNPVAWVGDTVNAYTDLRIYTYYPFVPGTDFQHRPPSTLEGDMNAMVARSPGTPILMQEVGYSSSAACGSTPALQAEFAGRFRRWLSGMDRSRVLGASFFLYTDWTSGTVNRLTGYYGFASPGFRGYLGELGLRDSLGRAKPAWEAWRNP
jgi:hypothetical protein